MSRTPAPAFSLPATGEQTIQLADYLGKPVVLYFYPKDNTPGCTTESQQFRDAYPEFTALGCAIFGISRDSLKSHANFKAKQELPFELLSDTDSQVCQLFQVIKQKNMYGKQVQGIERSTFLVDPEGYIHQEWRGVKVPGHVEQVLAAVRQLVKT